MDLNHLLLWIVGSSSVVSLVQLYRLGMSGTTGRKIVCVFLLAVVGGGVFLIPATAGYVSGAFWCFLMLIPGLAMRWLKRLVAAEDFGRAAAISRWMNWIYPFDHWRVPASIYAASALAKAGSLDAAGEILERYRHDSTPLARTAIAQLFKLQKRWEEYLAWLDENVSPHELEAQPTLLMLRLRAWGETGRLNLLLAGFQALDRRFHSIPSYRDVARLMLLTFFGKTDLLAMLFDGPLAHYPAEIRERWLATARAAGTSTSPAEAEPVFARLHGELAQEKRYGAVAVSTLTRPFITYSFIVINVLVFAVEMLKGGSTDDDVLMRMGALVPEDMSTAECWRLLAATFLHFGPMHLAMNMVGLWVLGPFVERILRGWRFVVCYLGAGIASMGVVVLVSKLGYLNDEVLVGASGSIMGLVGATAAIGLRDSRVLKTSASMRCLRRAGFIIVAQFVFDAMTPQVSMTAHLGGAASGFILTLLLGAGR